MSYNARGCRPFSGEVWALGVLGLSVAGREDGGSEGVWSNASQKATKLRDSSVRKAPRITMYVWVQM